MGVTLLGTRDSNSSKKSLEEKVCLQELMGFTAPRNLQAR